MGSEAILIVDDSPSSLKLAQLILEHHGYVVKTANDAQEALLALETFRPELILMDIQLPGMNGIELTRRLKADQILRSISVVALTAHVALADHEQALNAGCEGYITKPIDALTFASTVASFLASPAAS